MSERSSRKRNFAPLVTTVLVLFALAALFAFVTWMPLRSARADWSRGHTADAISRCRTWSQARMWPNQYHQVMAVAYATSRQASAADAELDKLRGKKLLLSVIPKNDVARALFAQGQYNWFLKYDTAVQERSEPAETGLFRAAAYAMNAGTVGRAQEVLRTIDRSTVDAKKFAALEASIAQRSSGRFPYVLDRDGNAIALWDMASNLVVAPHDEYVGFIDGPGGKFTIAAQKDRLGGFESIDTTLDSKVQHAAKAAIATFHGSLVAIDPSTNEILAIASNDPKGRAENLALEQQYEPGSIIKVLTGMNALASGVDVKSMFPYHCGGDLLVDGRHFGDWLPQGHGQLADFDDALAESCNVVFADIGIRLGEPRLRHFMTQAGFDGQTDLGLFQVPLGRIKGEIFNKFETGFLAIGLEHETVTALHVAMLASMVANRGVMTPPALLRSRRSILGEVVQSAPKQTQTRIAAQEAAQRMVQAMVAVVTKPKGTGRRADIEGVSLALKTGTAGKREHGFQAVIIAFAPVESPKIAFGIIAEGAGPAEYAGAKIAHDFLTGIQDRLK